MAIINCKEAASGPILNLLEFGSNYIKNNGYSVLIVVPYNALMSIGRVGRDHSILLAGELGRVIRSNESVNLLLFHLHVLLLLLNSHNESSVSCQSILRFRLRQILLLFLSDNCVGARRLRV